MIQPSASPLQGANSQDEFPVSVPNASACDSVAPALGNSLCPVIQPGEPIDPFALVEITERMRRFTEQLMPGTLKIEVDTDPEFGDRKICFEVKTSGTVDQLADWNRRWLRESSFVAQEYRPYFVLFLVSAE